MKNKISLLMLLLVSLNLAAQTLTVRIQPANPFFTSSEDLFRMSIFNPTAKEILINISGQWFSGNQKVVTLTAENVTIRSGLNQLSISDFVGVKKTYHSRFIETSEQNTSFLPPGSYKACVQVRCAKADCSGAGSDIISTERDNCLEITVSNPTPLLLSSPPNGAVLDIYRPNFTWIPPMIFQQEKLEYNLTLVKKRNSKQGCTDAITRNRPILKQTNVESPFLSLPGDFPDLDTGEYAWRVEAILNRHVVTSSDVWCFAIKTEKEEIKDSNVYVKLTVNDDNVHSVAGDLYFIYEEVYSSEKLAIQLFDPSGKEIKVSDEFITQYGENRFILPLKPLGIKKNSIYKIRFRNQAGKVYQLKFSLI